MQFLKMDWENRIHWESLIYFKVNLISFPILVEYGPEGCPPETDGIKVTRQGDTCLIFHLTWPSSYHTALETCRNHFSGGLLTIRNSTKMDFVDSVLSGLGMKTDYDAMSHLDRFNNEIGTHAHKMAWLGLFYSDQWRWPALLGMYYAWHARFHGGG